MDRLNKILLIASLVLLTIVIILFSYNNRLNDKINDFETFNEVQSYADSIKLRRLDRKHREIIYLYRDSLRQEKINNLILANEKSRKKTKTDISSVALAPDSTRDAIWTTEWAIKDSLPF